MHWTALSGNGYDGGIRIIIKNLEMSQAAIQDKHEAHEDGVHDNIGHISVLCI